MDVSILVNKNNPQNVSAHTLSERLVPKRSIAIRRFVVLMELNSDKLYLEESL